MSKTQLTHRERRARRLEMARCVESGMPADTVAGHFGVALATVYAACREHRVDYRRVSVDEQVVRALLDGEPPEVIIERYGITCNRLARLRNKHKLPPPRRHVLPRPHTLDIVADLIHGRGTLSEIARRYRLTRQRVDQIKRKCVAHDIPLHKRYG